MVGRLGDYRARGAGPYFRREHGLTVVQLDPEVGRHFGQL